MSIPLPLPQNLIREYHFNVPDSLYKQIYWDIDNLSIDFLREVDRTLVKKALFYSKSWTAYETIEQHMKRYFPHLKEFWKEMLNEEEYYGKRSNR